MPVQHIEVNASTLKARSRVVLTEEEAQLLTKVHNTELLHSTDTDTRNRVVLTEDEAQLLSKVNTTDLLQGTDPENRVVLTEEESQLFTKQDTVTLTTDSVTLAGGENTMYLVEDTETGQVDGLENVYARNGIETTGNQTKVVDTQPRMTSLLTNHMATEASQNPAGRQRTKIIVTRDQPQVQSILEQVTKERMTKEVVTAVKSIQEDASPAPTLPEHARKSPMRTVKLIRKQTPGNSATAGKSSVLHLKRLLPTSSKVPGNVKVLPQWSTEELVSRWKGCRVYWKSTRGQHLRCCSDRIPCAN